MVRDLFNSASRPKELAALWQVKFGKAAVKATDNPLEELALSLSDRDFCYAALNKVSRSFAVVIQQLPEELRDPVCIFYLILRGLDSVEDDADVPVEQKLELLRSFDSLCTQDDFHLHNVGDSHDYRVLLNHFHKVSRVLNHLEPGYKNTILDICREMGEGMACFTERKVNSIRDYDLYCYYVAGLVGIGLSGLFSASGHELPQLRDQKKISNSMGLFLQKTNITRDYLEDLHSSRLFWPSEIWSQYTDEIGQFALRPEHPDSLAALNHMVTDALRHVPDCFTYMKTLRNSDVFRFCAIPQIMAMGTLSLVYDNPDVFRGVVKLRKGLTARIMVETRNMEDIFLYFKQFLKDIARKARPADPSYAVTMQRLKDIELAMEGLVLFPHKNEHATLVHTLL